MTLRNWNVAGPLAVAAALIGSGFGSTAFADEKKPPAPADPVKKPQPAADGDKPVKPAADGVKPAKPGDGTKNTRTTGRIGKVNGEAKTFTLFRKG